MKLTSRILIAVLVCLVSACREPAPTWRGLPIPPEAEEVSSGDRLPVIDTLRFVVNRPGRYDGVHDFYAANLGPEWEPCPGNRPWWATKSEGRAVVEKRRSTWIDIKARRRLLITTEYRGSRRGLNGDEPQNVTLSDATIKEIGGWRDWLRNFCQYEGNPRRPSRR